MSLLDGAGWVDEDGDGIRSRDGQPLTLNLMTNTGNEVRGNLAVILEENLEAIGFDIQLEIIDFGTVVDRLLGQSFDMVLIGWSGLGSDPDDRWSFSFRNDVIGSGFNFYSYYDEVYEDNIQAGAAVPGCIESARAPYYLQNQQIFHEQAIYAPLYIPIGTIVYNERLQGIAPTTWSFFWNMKDWYFTE